MTAKRGTVSLGIAGALGAAAATVIAPAVERAGFHALWVNDTPGADSLAMLAAAAAVTDTLTLATGVIPVDRRRARDVAADVVKLGLPVERVMIGIGSGGAHRGALALVGDATRDLRELTGARVVVGALGPRMRRLAAGRSDGVVLNWLTPTAAAAQAEGHHSIDPSGHVVLYVRTSLEAAGRARLEEEAARYGSLPKYAANFTRMGVEPLQTVLPLAGDDDIGQGVSAYARAVDEVVLRAVTPNDDVAEYLRFIERARELLAQPPA